jgi:dTDP-4-dehydrorhamnose reductase
MSKKKIFILGASGMAGHIIHKYLKSKLIDFEIISISRNHALYKSDFNFNINDLSSFQKLVLDKSPQVIINCIGILNKKADESLSNSILVNSFFPHFLEEITCQKETRIIHLSTDCVFSGFKGNYLENDFKDGTGFYSLTKSLGEIDNKKDLTIRTSIIGPDLNSDGIGLFNWYSKQSGFIYGYKNAIWTGVTTLELAKFIETQIYSSISGIIHLVNNNKISKFDLIHLFKDAFNSKLTICQNEDYRVDKSLYNSRLDLDYKVKSYRDMVVEMKNWIIDNRVIYNHYEHLIL